MKTKAKEGTLKTVNGSSESQPPAKRRRWDVPTTAEPEKSGAPKSKTSWDAVEGNTPSQSR